MPMQWTQISEGLWLFRDSCNVYAVRGPGAGGLLIIDAGTGAWLDHLSQLPARPAALLLTHYFRDHAAGAVRAARQGIPVHVPQYERAIIADPGQHFRERETYIIYDNIWNLFAPIEATPVAGVMLDYELKSIAGLSVETIPLPGATLSQSGYGITLPTGKKIVFCGETIHSRGKVPRVAPWQYNYNDCGGAYNTAYSLHQLAQRRDIDILLPSLGEPITGDVRDAIVDTKAAVWKYLDVFGRGLFKPETHDAPPLTKVTDHVYVSTHSNARAWFLIGESGRVLTIDYGYDWNRIAFPSYARPAQRRALLHGIEGLKDLCGATKIDVALISHFHDDHVAGVPMLQRLHGTECWASEAFHDLLAHPDAHCFPCDWPQPIRIDRRIPLNEKVKWEQFTFHFGAMSGHTRFAALIGFEADGKRFAHVGDQVFFKKYWMPDSPDPDRVVHNHVYRNGALLDGFHLCSDWVNAWRPDILLNGHSVPMFNDGAHEKLIADAADEYRDVHRDIMPLGDDEAHLNLDSWGGWIWPYRVVLPAAKPVKVKVTVRNPFPRRATLQVRLVGPAGWSGEAATLDAGPRAEVSCDLAVTPAGPCRRQPFAVELTADGRPYGQVAEALMTVGHPEF